MRRTFLLPVSVAIVGAFAVLAWALDPPHDWLTESIPGQPNNIDCSSCHTPHAAPGGAITIAAGNANVCYTCHVAGGKAAAKALGESDQALPAPGLPAGVSAVGTSHRWDSGPAGHVTAVAGNTSTGTVQSGGDYAGYYAKTYTITITTAGDVGTAYFSWTATTPPGGSGPSTVIATSATPGVSAPMALDQGITVTFADGASPAGCGYSFCVDDRWRVYVRTDLNQPTTAAMALRVSDGKIMCSTCHDQHSQAATPFDPGAPAYGGSGTGAGRHFQRVANDAAQMCLDCHSARNKGSLSGQTGNLTHPVGLARSIWNGLFKARASITLPLDRGADGVAGNTDDRIQCVSCHQPHFAPAGDGTLARMASITTLCTDCHTLADPATATHLSASTGVLWPGGQYGSNFPAITDTAKRGACTNCHQPHGWPDSGSPAQDYAKLLVEATGNICFTCHDSDGPSSRNVYDKFNPSPNYSTTGASGAPIDQVHDATLCSKCHNPHKVTSSARNTDPDTGDSYTQTYSKTGSYTRDGFNKTYYSATTNLDPTNPAGAVNVPASWKIGSAQAAPTNTGDDAAYSGGTYSPGGDTADITYTVTVTRGGLYSGCPTNCPQITVTSTGNRDNSGPTNVTADNSTVAVGTRGITIRLDDPSTKASLQELTLNDQWSIAVTWDPGVTTCAPNCVEPDFVTFCLTCHDGTTPAGVTMPPTMVNVATEFFTRDQHGSVAGNTGTQISKGYKKTPWTTSTQFNAGQEPANPYAALQCATCHDGHGSGNIFHLKDSIDVAGYQMKIGGEGQCANGTSCGPWTAANGFSRSGNTTYTLPCSGGNGNPDCSQNPTGSQAYLRWGAWCSFCHTQSAHTGVTESTSCNTGHAHGGGNF